MNLFLNLLSSRSLARPADGLQLLETLCRVAPDLAPDVYGNHEPLRTKFDMSNVGQSLSVWSAPPFLWKRRRPSVDGSVFMATGKLPQHAVVTLAVQDATKFAHQAVDLLQQWSSQLNPDFAFVHVPSDRDLLHGMKAGVVSPLNRAGNRHTMFVTTHTLRRYLPDVYWATVFGPAYVRHFGKDRLLSSPAFAVRELTRDVIYMQMSNDLRDLKSRETEVAMVRHQVKEHLGSDSFFDEELKVGDSRKIPEFHVRTDVA